MVESPNQLGLTCFYSIWRGASKTLWVKKFIDNKFEPIRTGFCTYYNYNPALKLCQVEYRSCRSGSSNSREDKWTTYLLVKRYGVKGLISLNFEEFFFNRDIFHPDSMTFRGNELELQYGNRLHHQQGADK